jgi:hypothetical protein
VPEAGRAGLVTRLGALPWSTWIGMRGSRSARTPFRGV